MNKVNDTNHIFRYNDFSDAYGGTEIMVSQLLKYVDNELLSKFDIIVSYPPRDFQPSDKPSILWIHDLQYDPTFDVLYDKDYQNKFNFFVFVSYYQRDGFIRKYNIPLGKCFVIKNAIEVIDNNYNINAKWNSTEKIKITYSSMPHKGLRLAYEVFKELHKIFENKIELNVYSNYTTYGKAHSSRNLSYESLYTPLKNHNGINYYGSLDHQDLLNRLGDTHIWFLPSRFEETSCISLMEAASSKCVLVHSDLGALPETSSMFGWTSKYNENINEHAKNEYNSLKDVINFLLLDQTRDMSNHLDLQKEFFDVQYSWIRRKTEWEEFLTSILK